MRNCGVAVKEWERLWNSSLNRCVLADHGAEKREPSDDDDADEDVQDSRCLCGGVMEYSHGITIREPGDGINSQNLSIPAAHLHLHSEKSEEGFSACWKLALKTLNHVESGHFAR